MRGSSSLSCGADPPPLMIPFAMLAQRPPSPRSTADGAEPCLVPASECNPRLQPEELLRVAAGLRYEFFVGDVTEFSQEAGGVGYVGRFVWLFSADGDR